MPAASPLLPLRDRRLALGGLVLISLVMPLANGGKWAFQSPAHFGIAWVCSLVYTLILGLGNRELWRRLQHRYPQVSQTRRRLWWLGISSVVYTSLATVAVTLGLGLVPGGAHASPRALLLIVAINLVPTLVGLLVYESRHSYQQWEENQHRADQLARAQTQAQLDALAQQLDPHFLFNSLNTLAALIEPANEPAQHYVEGLADVYRYVLLSRERSTVPLAEELAFVQTYVALQKVRFRDNIHVSYELPPAALGRHVAPLSVQVLVENALKHNEASQARPLHLRLAADAAGTALRVENTYQPRPAGLAPGTGTGLANVRQRYSLLGAPAPVAVEQAAGIFAVTLPLLPA
ncbi:sensor histidine kinase [Hymenobacter sp. BT559]|uniref:sensor histidine kinase n=1 Tax=Hymenobacter sp. BT559 TaxID=2795729 RepID=UPI0018EBCF0C|nr:histidine kinase [Hymenobacter sp. BT559]MBJ6145512.1 histidine kinase [Hymenobacter sp. BT559]